MLLEIIKEGNRFYLKNMKGDRKHYFVQANVKDIHSRLPQQYARKVMEKNILSENQKKAIATLQRTLSVVDNDFVKRKITQLSSGPVVKQTMTDDEALYLAMMDKYEL